MELIKLKDEYAGSLSGGQKKLLEIARSMMADPKLVLLDEPGAGVNPTLMHKLIDNIKTLRDEKGITFFLIEHDMDLVMNLCDPVIVMSEGTKLAEGTAEEIKQHIENLLSEKKINHEITWRLSGQPFLTPEGKLVNACQQAIAAVAGRNTVLSTAGGTSDGRFIAPTGAEVVELGVVNETIHQIDEHTNVNELSVLKDIYKEVLKQLLID